MKKNHKMTKDEKALIRRYLIWCFKTTKEELDRIDRYFTQYQVDQYLIEELKKSKEFKKSEPQEEFHKQVNDFIEYHLKKHQKAVSNKFLDEDKKEYRSTYLYQRKRLNAIEKAIVHFLGEKELKNTKKLYEEEMTRRILESREHR